MYLMILISGFHRTLLQSITFISRLYALDYTKLIQVKIYVYKIFKRHKIKDHCDMFRIVCDPSSGGIKLYLTEIIRSGSLMFFVCLIGVWQRNFESVECVCGTTVWELHLHSYIRIKLCYQYFQFLVVNEKKVEEHQSTLLEVYMPVCTRGQRYCQQLIPQPRRLSEYLKGTRAKKTVSLQTVTRWRGWMRHCAKSPKVRDSIPDGVIPSGSTMAPMSTQPLTQMSTRNISWGVGGLGVACWPLVPKFAGSNPTEAVGFLRTKKSSTRLPSEGK